MKLTPIPKKKTQHIVFDLMSAIKLSSVADVITVLVYYNVILL